MKIKNKLFIIGFLFVVFLFGCELGNTPTSKVEDYFSRYQMLDDDVTVYYADLAFDIDILEGYKTRYEDLIRNQYRNLTYEIKEEEIDGATATVTAQIEVVDYQKIIDKYNKADFDGDNEYHKQVLEALEDAKDKITYTIEFTVTKDEEDNWNVEPLSQVDRQKILGINQE